MNLVPAVPTAMIDHSQTELAGEELQGRSRWGALRNVSGTSRELNGELRLPPFFRSLNLGSSDGAKVSRHRLPAQQQAAQDLGSRRGCCGAIGRRDRVHGVAVHLSSFSVANLVPYRCTYAAPRVSKLGVLCCLGVTVGSDKRGVDGGGIPVL